MNFYYVSYISFIMQMASGIIYFVKDNRKKIMSIDIYKATHVVLHTDGHY